MSELLVEFVDRYPTSLRDWKIPARQEPLTGTELVPRTISTAFSGSQRSLPGRSKEPRLDSPPTTGDGRSSARRVGSRGPPARGQVPSSTAWTRPAPDGTRLGPAIVSSTSGPRLEGRGTAGSDTPAFRTGICPGGDERGDKAPANSRGLDRMRYVENRRPRSAKKKMLRLIRT